MMRHYLAFHTWPEEGVITFDLVSSESKSFLPMLSTIERIFGIARTPIFPGQVVAQPEFRYAHKLRGFHHDPSEIMNLFQVTDLGVFLGLLGMDYKKEVSLDDCNEANMCLFMTSITHPVHLFSFVFPFISGRNGGD